GLFSPTAAARSRYSFTVERAIRTLRDTAVSLSPSPSLSRSTSLIRRIATFGLGISPRPRKGATVAAITCRSAASAEPIRGAENAEIRCRIGAKSPAAFRRNRLPLSTEIRCRFAPIFCTGGGRFSRDKHGSRPESCPGGIRHLGGAKSDQALVWHRQLNVSFRVALAYRGG